MLTWKTIIPHFECKESNIVTKSKIVAEHKAEMRKIFTLDLGMILTATCWPLCSPFLTLAARVYPKCPLPTSSPSSYLFETCLENPKFLSKPVIPSASLPSGIDASFGFTEPCRRARTARICFAGDGGGNGFLKNRFGVELALAFAGDFFENR